MSTDNVSPKEVMSLSVLDAIEIEAHQIDRLVSILITHLSHFLDESGYYKDVEEACVLSEVIHDKIDKLILNLS